MSAPAIAFHLDLKAGHYRLDYLRALLPRLTAAGYTHLVVEFEDKVRLESTAGTAWHGAYTKDEFGALLDDARAAGLTPVPLIQTIGHLEFLLSHARYHSLRELPATAYQLCPSHPETLPFLRRFIDETLELFGNPPFIHLGADETYYLGACPACAARVAASSKSALYLEHLNALATHVLARGVRPMAWADMLLAHPEALDQVSRDLIWVDWDYNTPDGTPERLRAWGAGYFTAEEARAYVQAHPEWTPGAYVFHGEGLRSWPYIDFLTAQGFEVWAAPATCSHGDTPFVPRREHLPNVVGAAARMHGDPAPAGLLVTSWALRLHTLEAQWPLLLAPGLVQSAGATTAGLQDMLATAWLGSPQPAFFQDWPQAGQVLPNLHSYLGVDSACHYYGPADRLDALVERWVANGSFPLWYQVDAAEALRRTEETLAGYAAVAQTYRTLPDGPGVPFWRFAVQAQDAAGRALGLALRGTMGEKDAAAAGALLLETEALRDAYQDLLAPIYTPDSVERTLGMIFGGQLRYLTVAAG
jgi:hypothetical protein